MEAYQKNIVGISVLFATKIGALRPAAGISRRFIRHTNVGIALASCICLNKPVHSDGHTVYSG